RRTSPARRPWCRRQPRPTRRGRRLRRRSRRAVELVPVLRRPRRKLVDGPGEAGGVVRNSGAYVARQRGSSRRVGRGRGCSRSADRPLVRLLIVQRAGAAAAAEPRRVGMAEWDQESYEKQLLEDMRAHDGQVTAGPLAGHPLLVMTSKGAKSGQPRQAILTYS